MHNNRQNIRRLKSSFLKTTQSHIMHIRTRTMHKHLTSGPDKISRIIIWWLTSSLQSDMIFGYKLLSDLQLYSQIKHSVAILYNMRTAYQHWRHVVFGTSPLILLWKDLTTYQQSCCGELNLQRSKEGRKTCFDSREGMAEFLLDNWGVWMKEMQPSATPPFSLSQLSQSAKHLVGMP